MLDELGRFKKFIWFGFGPFFRVKCCADEGAAFDWKPTFGGVGPAQKAFTLELTL